MKAVFNLTIAFIFSVLVKGKEYPFKLIKLPTDNGARCVDGSAPSMHYKQGDPKKFIFFLQGGSWAIRSSRTGVLDYFYDVSNKRFGSSNKVKVEYEGEFFTSYDQKINPYFYDYSIMQLNNCDSAGHQGYSEMPYYYKGKELWMRGRKNVESAIKYAFEELGMDKADKVILGGYSSGAQSLYYWINEIGDQIKQSNPNAIVKGFADGGIFLDEKNIFTQEHEMLNKFKAMFEITNREEDPINKECVKENPNETYKCMMVQYVIKHIRYPILIVENQYDSSAGGNVIGTKCLKKRDFCTKFEWDAFEKYRIKLLAFFDEIKSYKVKHGFFSGSCRYHTLGWNSLYSDKRFAIPSGSGFTLQEATHAFFNKEEEVIHIDSDIWPRGNKECATIHPNIAKNQMVIMKERLVIIFAIFIGLYVALKMYLKKVTKQQQFSEQKNNKNSKPSYLELEQSH